MMINQHFELTKVLTYNQPSCGTHNGTRSPNGSSLVLPSKKICGRFYEEMVKGGSGSVFPKRRKVEESSNKNCWLMSFGYNPSL